MTALGKTRIPGKLIRGLKDMNRKQRRDWVKNNKDKIWEAVVDEEVAAQKAQSKKTQSENG